MARIKELREKVKKDEATPEEEAELKELETEAAEEEAAEDEKSVESMVSKFVDLSNARLEKMFAEKFGDKAIDEKEVSKDATGFKAEYEKMSDGQKIHEYYKALLNKDTSKIKVMSEGTNADGGFLIPTILYNRIIQEQLDTPTIRSFATVITNCPKQFNLDQLVGRPKSYTRVEKAIKHTSTATLAQISLTPYSLYCLVPMTNELIEDAEAGGSITALMTKLMVESINMKEDQLFATGTGTSEPSGIDSYNATVHRTIATPANVVAADTLIAAQDRLGKFYRRNAKWFMNSQTYTKVKQLKDSQNRYLFIPDPTGDTEGTILGKGVLTQDDLPLTRIWYGDIKGYYIGDRGTLSVKYSEEATLEGIGNLFERNMTAIRIEKRVDGELADLDSMIVITGTN